MILLLDTSTPVCRVTLYENDKMILDQSWQADRELSEKLLSFLETQFRSVNKSWGDISGIGVLQGPGSFTGLRIGISVLNTVASTRHVPIVGTTGDNWQEKALTRLKNGENDQLVIPFYGRDANTTTPRK